MWNAHEPKFEKSKRAVRFNNKKVTHREKIPPSSPHNFRLEWKHFDYNNFSLFVDLYDPVNRFHIET